MQIVATCQTLSNALKDKEESRPGNNILDRVLRCRTAYRKIILDKMLPKTLTKEKC